MAARAGLTEHIAQLRAMCAVGTSEYTVNGVSFWSDEQLQDALDQNRRDVYLERIAPQKSYDDTGVIYRVYPLGYGWVEGTTTTEAWNLRETDGDAVTADYTLDVRNGIVTFDADTTGKIYLVDFRAYDLNGAAALVWTRIGAHAAARFDVSTPDHSLKLSQVKKHAMEMAAYFRSLSVWAAGGGSRSVRMRRRDAKR